MKLLTVLLIQSVFLDQRPIIKMIHGFMAPCFMENEFLQRFFPDYDSECVESGLGLLMFESQI